MDITTRKGWGETGMHLLDFWNKWQIKYVVILQTKIKKKNTPLTSTHKRFTTSTTKLGTAIDTVFNYTLKIKFQVNKKIKENLVYTKVYNSSITSWALTEVDTSALNKRQSPGMLRVD